MKLLDLFCGAGGAAMGYHRAGFEVVGVDNRPQPHYPFEFHCEDAFAFLEKHGHEFDVIHASPPCQGYSSTKAFSGKSYPLLIEPLRAMLLQTTSPWIIENVEHSPLINPTLLCGNMFGLKTYRHRLFETSFELPFTLHIGHGLASDKLSGPNRRREMVTVVGKGGYKGANARYREAMEIAWMNEDEITEAIPPAYTEWIGMQLMNLTAARP